MRVAPILWTLALTSIYLSSSLAKQLETNSQYRLPTTESSPVNAAYPAPSQLTAKPPPTSDSAPTAENVEDTAVLNSDERPICAQDTGQVSHVSDDGTNLSDTVNVNGTEPAFDRCDADSRYCYALWREETVTSVEGTGENGGAISEDRVQIKILGQGCWGSGLPNDCDRNECVWDQRPLKNDTKFCCCVGNRCNTHIINAALKLNDSHYNAVPNSNTDWTDRRDADGMRAIVPNVTQIVGYSFCLIVFVSCVAIVLTWWQRRQPKKADVELGTDEYNGVTANGTGGAPGSGSHNDINVDKLQLIAIIGQGHYGSVWRATTAAGGDTDELLLHQYQRQMAVKVFPPHHRTYYLNEYDLYRTVGEHPHIVSFYGGGERILANTNSYLLALSLEKECVQDYLKRNTLDLATLSRMSLGIAKGLAHLHSDVGGKLCIAHRDLNTRNILVTADLQCRLCDLGLAVVPRRTENRSLSEAGTFRYMAPEVLEGAVNLRDCESALKQIDVYALGLVLWELGSRCVDMQLAEPEAYAPPFHHEIGDSPSLEQMQVLVSKHKARPRWPASWRDTAAARLLAETTEDCWDQDAEARLTSLCVEERLLELPTLRGRSLHPMLHPPASPTPLINNNHLHHHHDPFAAGNPIGHGTQLGHHNAFDASVGTIETLLSPSEEAPPPQYPCKNSNQLVATCVVLPPHQGRNACLERNLLSVGGDSSDSVLIDKSSKHCTAASTTPLASESEHLLAGDYINRSPIITAPPTSAITIRNKQMTVRTLAPPIPYVQNAVHDTSSSTVSAGPGRFGNDVTAHVTNQQRADIVNNRSSKKKNWSKLKKFFHPKRNNVAIKDVPAAGGRLSLLKDTQVRMITPNKLVNYGQNGVTTSLFAHENYSTSTAAIRPSSLALNGIETNMPSPKPGNAGIAQLLRRSNNNLARQMSLEHVSEIFTSTSDLARLKDPAVRVKTPGDVPASVRRTRGRAAHASSGSTTRFSLYDDRMMVLTDSNHHQWGSAPDLDPPPPTMRVAPDVSMTAMSINRPSNMHTAHEQADRDSVSSF